MFVKARKLIIEQSKRAGVGHIGSALSIIDIVMVLYQDVLNLSVPDYNQRDRFVLSKGHAALALYVALHLKGILSEAELNTYCNDGSKLGVHPEHFVSGVDFSTGSLGQGVTFATGAALAAKIAGSERKVFCLLSDAELNEGSFWETILFATHHKLNNLTFILDNNGQQALGKTSEVLNIKDIGSKMLDFGFDTCEIDGHNIDNLRICLQDTYNSLSPNPKFIVANTICGKGVSYMESTIKWHYSSMSEDQYLVALSELE